MGCDGGTIPRRDELVRVQKKPEQKDKEAELAFRWKHCNISQQPLQAPIVACGLGRLYSKESVLEGLMDRSMLPASAKHIKKMRDVKDLNLAPNPAFEGFKAKNGDMYEDQNKSAYICPVTGLEMNGKYKFVFLWSCGCAMSERALKEVKTNICHNCQKPFDKTDIVILNAENDDLKLMQQNLTLRKSNQKLKKLQNAGEGSSSDNVAGNEDKEEKEELIPTKKIKKEDEEEDGEQKKKKKAKREEKKMMNGKMPHDPAYEKTRPEYSVAKDPKATEVYKSLFTSHESAKSQQRAHWVTYNPFYN